MRGLNKSLLERVKKAHLIGICGIGMSGIAEYLLRRGINVTGSDLLAGGIAERLNKYGAEIYIGHREENVKSDVDIVIYSSAIKQDNPEITEALKKNIKIIRRAEMLGGIVNDMKLIGVSGTHGKTTTTSMISKILIDAGTDPIVFVGGNLDFLEGGSSRIGNGNTAVVEADEYDRSFLALKPDIIIINNLELDHTDIYGSLEEVKTAFTEFCDCGKKDVSIIINADDENTMSIINNTVHKKVITFGKNPKADFKLKDINYNNNETIFSIENSAIDIIKLIITGEHNVYNAAASYTACISAGISKDSIKKSLSEFTGLKRRLELMYKEDITVYDDYAHHPTEVRKSFNAIKCLAKGRVITIFQPHTFTRTHKFYKEFADSLIGNDIVFLAKVYPAREHEIEGVSSILIFNEIKEKTNNEVYYFESNDILLKKLMEVVQKGDTIIFQGAGDITSLCGLFINDYRKAG